MTKNLFNLFHIHRFVRYEKVHKESPVLYYTLRKCRCGKIQILGNNLKWDDLDKVKFSNLPCFEDDHKKFFEDSVDV